MGFNSGFEGLNLKYWHPCAEVLYFGISGRGVGTSFVSYLEVALRLYCFKERGIMFLCLVIGELFRYSPYKEKMRYDMIYLTAIGQPPGGSSSVHI